MHIRKPIFVQELAYATSVYYQRVQFDNIYIISKLECMQGRDEAQGANLIRWLLVCLVRV